MSDIEEGKRKENTKLLIWKLCSVGWLALKIETTASLGLRGRNFKERKLEVLLGQSHLLLVLVEGKGEGRRGRSGAGGRRKEDGGRRKEKK